ncbi:uncharacterized protein BDV14DRAFT_162216 [Aspergillus stella-maris]|uniref:uncharacterized protein n=1 Tax=Aspergillus stella-maris TaxID=1810926 RepID=UPI003CCE3F3E
MRRILATPRRGIVNRTVGRLSLVCQLCQCQIVDVGSENRLVRNCLSRNLFRCSLHLQRGEGVRSPHSELMRVRAAALPLRLPPALWRS